MAPGSRGFVFAGPPTGNPVVPPPPHRPELRRDLRTRERERVPLAFRSINIYPRCVLDCDIQRRSIGPKRYEIARAFIHACVSRVTHVSLRSGENLPRMDLPAVQIQGEILPTRMLNALSAPARLRYFGNAQITGAIHLSNRRVHYVITRHRNRLS